MDVMPSHVEWCRLTASWGFPQTLVVVRETVRELLSFMFGSDSTEQQWNGK